MATSCSAHVAAGCAFRKLHLPVRRRRLAAGGSAASVSAAVASGPGRMSAVLVCVRCRSSQSMCVQPCRFPAAGASTCGSVTGSCTGARCHQLPSCQSQSPHPLAMAACRRLLPLPHPGGATPMGKWLHVGALRKHCSGSRVRVLRRSHRLCIMRRRRFPHSLVNVERREKPAKRRQKREDRGEKSEERRAQREERREREREV